MLHMSMTIKKLSIRNANSNCERNKRWISNTSTVLGNFEETGKPLEGTSWGITVLVKNDRGKHVLKQIPGMVTNTALGHLITGSLNIVRAAQIKDTEAPRQQKTTTMLYLMLVNSPNNDCPIAP